MGDVKLFLPNVKRERLVEKVLVCMLYDMIFGTSIIFVSSIFLFLTISLAKSGLMVLSFYNTLTKTIRKFPTNSNHLIRWPYGQALLSNGAPWIKAAGVYNNRPWCYENSLRYSDFSLRRKCRFKVFPEFLIKIKSELNHGRIVLGDYQWKSLTYTICWWKMHTSILNITTRPFFSPTRGTVFRYYFSKSVSN